ncbi:acetyl-CoA hydrolase/transferase family protein [Chakrabartyella piscis]|uniref:acetyl-CoA hydrolase/transferase family protein n=1 Tax=Chakrabartyella piscis TaxID=2918914 RepID=UPI002958AF56|nr:acetyl-CoA hydrolase/transferase C-terminal domain-containing protein [Chakrabartyella piscis]
MFGSKEDVKQLYAKKYMKAEEIAEQIQSGDICVSSDAYGEPQGIVEAITKRAQKGELVGVEHHLLLANRPWEYLSEDLAGKFTHTAWFTSGYSRGAVQGGYADFLPNNYSDVPTFWKECISPDVAYMMVSPMDEHGYFSFGLSASQNRVVIERAGRVYLEVNQYMPRTSGDNFIHIREVTGVCENHQPLPTLGAIPLNEKDHKIGAMIAERIPNGATIQLGIGGMPNAVGSYLKDKKDLGIHTEMFVDSMVDLLEAGVITNSKKVLDRYSSITAFAMGSQRMYDYIHNNPAVKFCPVDYTNDPRVIAQNPYMTSINACVEVDLLGQVCSESIGSKNISGAGGQLDFVRGANWSKGGHSYICTYATAKGDTISKIRPTLNVGAHVTTPKGDVDCIVTEYGIAELRGKSASQRAKALIAVAHPKFREELTAEARKMNLMI